MLQTSLENISKLKCKYPTVQLLDAKVEQESTHWFEGLARHISRQCLDCTYWRKPATSVSNVSTLFQAILHAESTGPENGRQKMQNWKMRNWKLCTLKC